MILKGFLSLALLAAALYAGFGRLPLWAILVIGIPFTVAYIHGKWYLWQPLFREKGRQFYQSLLLTYLIQLFVVAIFYLLGSGVARLFNQ